MDKFFLVSIDTEGDNLWSWDGSSPVTTENAAYLPRFQELCDGFGFRPTYLTNWEMIQDAGFRSNLRAWVADGRCEAGMHLHAWNSPPDVALEGPRNPRPGLPYLVEYPTGAMDAKIAAMTKVIEEGVGVRPVTHRAGRWAMDARYFALLAKHGYICDCSVTPHLSWATSPGATAGSHGPDYTSAPEGPHLVGDGTPGVLEVPLTVRWTHRIIGLEHTGLRAAVGCAYRALRGRAVQLRPRRGNWAELAATVDIAAREGAPYLMFMLHSSELMPAGSPAFPDEGSVEELYSVLGRLFSLVSKDFEGETIGGFARRYIAGGGVR